ncbi:hypothetical protein V4R14_05560 [Listeria monocytogenes]
MNKKFKQIILIFTLALSMFSFIGCQNKEKNISKFQNAYFEISSKAENKETFSKESLEKLIGSKSHKAKDINTYLFDVNDESLMVGLNSENKLDIVKYEKSGKVTLVNCLVDDTNIGGYTKGFTSDFKVDSLDNQKKAFENILN